MVKQTNLPPDDHDDKSRLAIVLDYFTGGGGGEFDTYRDADLYDRGAHSSLYRRDNLARGMADVTEDVLGNEATASILDIGAGTGILTLELAGRGNTVTALDLFAEPLKRLREKADAHGLGQNVEPVQADMNVGLPFADASFEAVVSLRATRYIQNFDHWLTEAHRTLVPGGKFVLPVFPVDFLPWKRHSDLGARQATTARAVRRAVVKAGFDLDADASGAYDSVVDRSQGQRDVPIYYKPTFVVATKPAHA